MLPKASIFLTFLLCLLPVRSATTEVEQFFDLLDNLTSEVVDSELAVIAKLKEVVNRSHELLREVGAPVGALVASTIGNITTSENDTLTVMALLHNRTKSIVKTFEKRRRQLKSSNLDDYLLVTHEITFTSHLNNFFDRLIILTHPEFGHFNDKEALLTACRDADPVYLVEYLERIYKFNCPLLTKDKISLYVMTHRVFKRIESKIPVSKWSTWQNKYYGSKHRILARITGLNSTAADAVLAKLEKLANKRPKSPDSYVKDLSAIAYSDGLTLTRTDKTSCLLELDTNANGYLREHLLALMQVLTIDLLKIELTTVACTDITNEGNNRTAINGVLNHVASQLEEIGKHVISWVEHMQYVSWPEIGIEAGQDALGFKSIPVLAFNNSAYQVLLKLEKRGSASASYQVLITDSKPKNAWSFLTQDLSNYANFTNFNGIDCHIFRCARNSSDRAVEAAQWFQEHHKYIKTSLENNTHLDSTKSILETIDRDVGPLVSSRFFRFALLLRNKALFWGNPKIYVCQASSDQNTTSYVVGIDKYGFFASSLKLILLL
ncbi:hypothetical protein L596_025237 [Steinernema carpocapsae]|uniref:Uncharacterized protein n=1 Tax=Steinernema carpocapsae TaxID=34508 RepID=A0A4U5M772_STECR|nr:hypothetical protein L596_025237 [Steinernema carpocapsae]